LLRRLKLLFESDPAHFEGRLDESLVEDVLCSRIDSENCFFGRKVSDALSRTKVLGSVLGQTPPTSTSPRFTLESTSPKKLPHKNGATLARAETLTFKFRGMSHRVDLQAESKPKIHLLTNSYINKLRKDLGVFM